VKEVVAEFEERLSVEVRRQEKLNIVEKGVTGEVYSENIV